MSREIITLEEYKAYANAKTEYTDEELQMEIDIANEEVLNWINYPDIETFVDKFVFLIEFKKLTFNLVNVNIEPQTDLKSQSLVGNSVSFRTKEEMKKEIYKDLSKYKAMFEVESVLE